MDWAATPTQQQTTTTTMWLLFVLFATTILRTSRVGFVLPTLTIHFATTSAMHLHTTQTTGSGIRVLLIHGLDSSSRTWSLFGRAMKNPTTAMDQRTCGLSENGDVRDFDQDALVDDIHELVCGADASTTEKVVLLGHSLGGRIALGYAAKYPDRVAALIIEDMDIQKRSPSNGLLQFTFHDGIIHFERSQPTKEALVESLLKGGFTSDVTDKWVAEGRIEERNDGTWWSHVNPMFRVLCYEHVLGTDNGKRDCQTIQSQNSTFPCHLMVADDTETVCSEESIAEMHSILGERLGVHRYPGASHSIHRTKQVDFLKTVEDIIGSLD